MGTRLSRAQTSRVNRSQVENLIVIGQMFYVRDSFDVIGHTWGVVWAGSACGIL